MGTESFPKPVAFVLEELLSALALMGLRIQAPLQSRPIRDRLTGVYSRRYMNELLKRELRRAIRNKRPLALILFDVDRFQMFNGDHGHMAGDVFLQALGKYFINSTSDFGIPARTAGDEFVILAPNTSREAAEGRARQLLEGIKQLQVPYDHQIFSPPPLSFAVAIYPDDGSTGESLLHAADEAIYIAKSKDRKRLPLTR